MRITVQIDHDGDDAFAMAASGHLEDMASAEPRAKELAELLVAEYQKALLGANSLH